MLYSLLFASVFLNLLIGAVVLWHGPRRVMHIAFFAMTVGAGLWVASFALISATGNFAFNQYVFHGGTLLFAGFLVFARTFPRDEKPPRRFWLLLLPLALLAAGTPLDLFVYDIAVVPDGGVKPLNGPLMPLHAMIAGGTVLYGIMLLIRTYRRAEGADRTKMQYFFLGLTMFMGTAILTDGILPAFGIFAMNTAGPSASIIFIGLTAYAMIRHHLLDVRIVIQRGALYMTLLTIIIATYLAVLFFFAAAYRGPTELTALASAVMTTVLGIFGAPRIEQAFRRVTDRFFFKDTYDYADALQELSAVLNRHLDLAKLAAETGAALRRILKIEAVRLNIIRMGDPPSAVPGEVFVIPIIGADGPVGTITLGPKRSGDSYDARDIQLLETFADHAAVALEKAALHAELQRRAATLEERVEERTAELRTLRENERQTMMDISHAVQTPLTVIQGEVEAMKRGGTAGRGLAAIEKAATTISQSAYALLRLARLERAEGPEIREPADLSALAEEVLEYVGTVCDEKRIALERDILHGIWVTGDRAKLEELLTNLLSNAVRYMDGGGPERRIAVSLRREDGRAALRVADTGRGIPPEELPRIFERFHRAPGGPQSGTGLGLAIAKRIATLHGGKISVESTPGKGTVFTVKFPVARI